MGRVLGDRCWDLGNIKGCAEGRSPLAGRVRASLTDISLLFLLRK